MDAGLFDEAVQVYEEILAAKPTDEDAAIGLKKARDASIDKKLIETRMARLSNNFDQSMNLLLRVVELENQWKMAPGGKVAFTQEEEKAFGLEYLQRKVARDLKERMPLRSEFVLRKYRVVYLNEPSGRYRTLQAQVQESGKKTCQNDWKKDVLRGKPYYTSFIRQICAIWGEPVDFPADEQQALLSGHYGSTKIKLDVSGISGETRALWTELLGKGFRATAWYEQGAQKVLELAVQGELLETKSKNSRYQVHFYSVSEPYTEYVKVRKPVPGNPRQFTEELEKQTRYRSVQKEHGYMAYEIEQSLKFNATLLATLGERGSTLSVGQTGETGAKGIEHYENIPSIGLSPKKVVLENAVAFGNSQVRTFAAKYDRALASKWIELYCGSMAQGGGRAESGELATKCMRQPTDLPSPFIDDWLQRHFGVQSLEYRQLIRWLTQQQNG